MSSFIFAYLLHRNFSFKNSAKLGVAIYASKDSDVHKTMSMDSATVVMPACQKLSNPSPVEIHVLSAQNPSPADGKTKMKPTSTEYVSMPSSLPLLPKTSSSCYKKNKHLQFQMYLNASCSMLLHNCEHNLQL